MKKLKKVLIMAICLLFAANAFSQGCIPAPFTKGVNLSKWFETWTPGIPNLRVYGKEDFEHVKEIGCDVIRIPIHFNMFEDEKGKIKPVIFEYLDKACDWAEELGLYIIIDNHSFNSAPYPNAATVRKALENEWPQIAEHFKKRSNHILFEILNEPQFSNAEWEPIQADILKLIRKTDTKHIIVVTGANWSSLDAMCTLKPLEDNNIIYTFHYYDPFVFTHQGASWSEKAISDLHDIPFPYDKDKMPELPESTKKSWVYSNLRNEYPKSSTDEGMRKQLKKAVEFSNKTNAPVWCGEMGVYDLVAPEDSRNRWYAVTGSIFADYKIPFTVWGWDDSFGIFNPKTQKKYPDDLNKEVLKGLGMKFPENANPANANKSALPLIVYDDFGGYGMNINNWSSKIFTSDYDKNTGKGMFCIQWGNVQKYGAISTNLTKIDLTEIKGKADKTVISFMVKFENADQKFQLRFVDSDETDTANSKNPPYRLTYNIKASDTKLGKWKKFEIPLSSMLDAGGWSNKTQKWYSSNGDFDWSRVESLEFAAEEAEIKENIFIDEVRIYENF